MFTTWGDVRRIISEAGASVKIPRLAQFVKVGDVYRIVKKDGVTMMTTHPEELDYELNKAGKRFSPFGLATTTKQLKFKNKWKYVPKGRFVWIQGDPVKTEGDPNDYNHKFQRFVFLYKCIVGEQFGEIAYKENGRVDQDKSDISWNWDEDFYMDVRDLGSLDVGKPPKERTEKLPLVVGREPNGELRYADVECIITADGTVSRTASGDEVWTFDPETLETDYFPSYFEVLYQEVPVATLTSIESGEI